MQVDPKPSPWPCVLMLVALLLFCLAVPRFWRSGDAASRDDADGSAAFATYAPTGPAFGSMNSSVLGSSTSFNPFPTSSFHELELRLSGGILPGNNLLSLCPPPTIEELIESARLRTVRNNPIAGFPPGNEFGTWGQYALPLPTNANTARSAPRARSALVTAVLTGVGRAIAERSLMEMLQPVAASAWRLHQLWPRAISGGPESPPDEATPVLPDYPPIEIGPPIASSIRLVTPEDRLAALPPPVVPVPQAKLPDQSPVSEPPLGGFATAADAAPWCVPQVLYDQLERLACHPDSGEWAHATIVQLRAVTARDCWEREDVSSLLGELSQSAAEATKLADETADDRLRVELLRAHWGLARRLDCWFAAHEIRVAQRASARVATRGSLNSLFADGPPAQAIHTDATGLANDLEEYERKRDPQVGREVAEKRRALETSDSPLDRTLADAVEQHYRNANVRVALTSALLNRLVSKQRSEVGLVRDRIAGTPVRGQSHTIAESSIRLQPAEGRWQFDVEAQGVVDSRTLANGGRARLRSRSSTDFQAQKTVVVDPGGVRLQPTMVNATNHSRLVGVTTDFDWVPLLGSLARNRAVQEYRARRPRARAEVESKVAALAVEQMDEETLVAIDRVEEQVRARLLDPMAAFGVDLIPIELTTTEDRLVARLRIAGNQQLGGHTPRPRALSDSLASVQVHESALNNAAVSLGLDGRRHTALELQAHLRERFPGLASGSRPEARHDTVFEFAYRDAVQFRIDGGRLELMIGLSCLELQGRKMHNVIVHAFYAPVVDGLDAQLVRDGALGIEGRLSSTDRARLHNVFNTVLSEERRLPIVQLGEAASAKLDGLTITQLVLEDGWIGMAIGPATAERVAEQSRSLR